MNGPDDQMMSPDDESRECKAELPEIIANSLAQRTIPFIGNVPTADRDTLIARSIEIDIIPRLLMAHLERPLARTAGPSSSLPSQTLDDEHIARFADMIVNESIQTAIEHVSGLVAGGTTMDAVFSTLFAGAARVLGQRWEDDKTSFLDVTLGLANLQQLLRRFSPDFERSETHEPNGKRILLAAMPGEAHTFGMTVVEEYFRRDGWTVTVELPAQAQSLLNVLRESWYDVVGLSIGNAGATGELTQLIREIRRASINGSVRVVIGGCALPLAADAIQQTGADMFAASAEDAVREAGALLRRSER